ncbi:MAG TPA: condensation domain-containing protein, partial [Candidatus Megaira endosymbiont of Mesostigma viride]|nr:condensation domain-containing protein [Candidatus Megaira endosymbiont of Mesostigma viride]
GLVHQYMGPRDEVEAKLCKIWAEVLGLERVGIYDNFFEIGGDSILSIQITHKARADKLYFKVKDIFDRLTVANLSQIVNTNIFLHIKTPYMRIEGCVKLLPIQHWFFERNFTNLNHFNLSVFLELNKDIDFEIFQQALDIIVDYHDILKVHFVKNTNSSWKQVYLNNINRSVKWKTVDLHIEEDLDLIKEIKYHAIIAQKSLNIENGDLIQGVFFNCLLNKRNYFFWVIHHLVVDAISWSIILEDLNTAYNDLLFKRNLSLPVKTHSYQQWSNALYEYSQSPMLNTERAYWMNIINQFSLLPVDKNSGVLSIAGMNTINKELDENETLNLLKKVSMYKSEFKNLLLTALVLAFGDWKGSYKLSLFLEAHGREDTIGLDVSRTVGWFTTLFPINLKLSNPQNISLSINQITEILKNIPNKGIGYGVLRYLVPNSQNLSPEIDKNILIFNYLGQWDKSYAKSNNFHLSNEDVALNIDNNNQSYSLIKLNIAIINGRLTIYWGYSRKHYLKDTMEKLVYDFLENLKKITISPPTETNLNNIDLDLVDIDQVTLLKQIIEA